MGIAPRRDDPYVSWPDSEYNTEEQVQYAHDCTWYTEATYYKLFSWLQVVLHKVIFLNKGICESAFLKKIW